jgi:hypothetical protein
MDHIHSRWMYNIAWRHPIQWASVIDDLALLITVVFWQASWQSVCFITQVAYTPGASGLSVTIMKLSELHTYLPPTLFYATHQATGTSSWQAMSWYTTGARTLIFHSDGLRDTLATSTNPFSRDERLAIEHDLQSDVVNATAMGPRAAHPSCSHWVVENAPLSVCGNNITIRLNERLTSIQQKESRSPQVLYTVYWNTCSEAFRRIFKNHQVNVANARYSYWYTCDMLL